MKEKLRNRKILLVDDDERNRFALSTYLETLDMRVLTASDGQTALRMLQSPKTVDLILLDIMMPGLDGYEVLRLLKSDTALCDIPVIAVTARAMKGDDQKCLDAGASDYVAKPIDLNTLISKMALWL